MLSPAWSGKRWHSSEPLTVRERCPASCAHRAVTPFWQLPGYRQRPATRAGKPQAISVFRFSYIEGSFGWLQECYLVNDIRFVHRANAAGHQLGEGTMVATPTIRMTSVSGAPSEYLLSERYEALIRVSQASGAHREPADLFRAMATELHRVVQFDGIVVAQYDEASNEILWSTCEVCSQQGPISPPKIPADETVTKWVYERQEPLVIPSLDRETRFPRMIAFLAEKGFQSVCALP